ncbi:MAG: glutamyl-tRNA reductase [Betaproteobacteria bacterium]|nr:glutamyl-tRNA reductase [Betaproteobacteria bacterium]
MRLFTLGLNHTTAGIALRERVAFPAGRVSDALADLRRRLSPAVAESAILSTCSRTEIYCAVRDVAAAQSALVEWLAERSNLPAGELWPNLYALPQRHAVLHAFRVASGLDSMVLGEPQILGQMKEAARRAQDAGTLGPHLHQLFQRSFAAAKEVRSETEIGSSTVSMAAAAVRIAQVALADLREARVLFVGAGKMTSLAAAHFAAHNPREIAIASRTPEHAERLARRVQAHTLPLAEVRERLAEFDIVVCGTSSTLPIIGLGMVERATWARRGLPLLMFDLAVPRDVEPEVGRLSDVFLYTVDDLGKVVESGVESRQAAVAHAEAIIEARVESFMHWMAARRTLPLMCTLDERAERLRAGEVKRARRLLARGEPADEVLEALASRLSNKFLHAPRTLLRRGTLAPNEAQRLVELCLPEQAQPPGAGPVRHLELASKPMPGALRAAQVGMEKQAA